MIQNLTSYMWSRYKYIIAYLLPIIVFTGIYFASYWSYCGLLFSFVILPILEIFFKGTSQNYDKATEVSISEKAFFNILLYLNIPILYFVLFYFIGKVNSLNNTELIGGLLSVGILIATSGINVAHELGHRQTKIEHIFSKILLLPALYMHFFIEHNRGHHKNVGTNEDPVSAKKGEIIYFFWIKAIIGEYISAWQLETQRLNKINVSIFSLQNEMIQFQMIQTVYLAVIFILFGIKCMLIAIAAAIIGVILLESINYIEHYGLRREKMANGFYEPVLPQHSWNSDHELGRIFLYELTRHSDHHYKSTRKYQILRHFDQSPQLPMGYPAALLLSLFPPIWFKIMDNKLKKLNKD